MDQTRGTVVNMKIDQLMFVPKNPPTPAICRGSAREKVALRRPWRPSSTSFGHLPGAFLEIFSWFQKATLGTRLALNASRRPRLPLNASRRPWRPSSMSFGHLPGAFLEIFFWFQKATLGTRLALNASRRPRLPLNPSRRPWRPSSMSFGHLPGAFLEIFFWFQKATLGTRLALNASRRPRLPLNASRRPWRPSSMSFGHLPGAFLEIFFWFQKATLGTRLTLKVACPTSVPERLELYGEARPKPPTLRRRAPKNTKNPSGGWGRAFWPESGSLISVSKRIIPPDFEGT